MLWQSRADRHARGRVRRDILRGAAACAFALAAPALDDAKASNGRVRGREDESAEPRALQGLGYARTFADDFHELDYGLIGRPGHKWYNGVPPNHYPSVPRDCFAVADSVLTITARNRNGKWDDPNLCTAWGRGGTYFDGDAYFEALIRPSNWTAFWAFGRHVLEGGSVDRRDPNTWFAEIDFLETSETDFPNSTFHAIHRNTGGNGGVRDETNQGATTGYSAPARLKPICGAWHKFACWRTASIVRFYVDDHEVCALKPYPSTAQPLAVILGIGMGGVNTGHTEPVPKGARAVSCDIDWVRVWQKGN